MQVDNHAAATADAAACALHTVSLMRMRRQVIELIACSRHADYSYTLALYCEARVVCRQYGIGTRDLRFQSCPMRRTYRALQRTCCKGRASADHIGLPPLRGHPCRLLFFPRFQTCRWPTGTRVRRSRASMDCRPLSPRRPLS